MGRKVGGKCFGMIDPLHQSENDVRREYVHVHTLYTHLLWNW